MPDKMTKSETEDKQVQLVDEFEQMRMNDNSWEPKVYKGFEVQCRKVGFFPVVDITTNHVQYCNGLFDFGDWLLGQVEKGREREAKLKAEVKRLQRESVEHMKSGQSR